MEEHRGEPRNKPPFPGVYGLWGKPTLMNSVETFAHVPVIVERGAEWWRGQGVGESTGLKFFAVSGHVERPGVYCVPMGTTGRELLSLLESGGGVEDVDDTIVQLEETMRLTSICGLGQVALGPVISVLGMERGGTAARPHPRAERAPEEEGGDPQDPDDPASDARGGGPGDPRGGGPPEGGASP